MSITYLRLLSSNWQWVKNICSNTTEEMVERDRKVYATVEVWTGSLGSWRLHNGARVHESKMAMGQVNQTMFSG